MKRLALIAVALAAAAPALAARPEVDGRAWFVQNARNGEVLVAHNARERVPIASITKLMTVLVTLEHASLDDVVTVSGSAASVGESTIYLRRGEQISVRDLIEAALIQSANDAARALAEHVGGGSVATFVSMMNERARAMGLRDTHFVTPDGLDAPGHYSSARDVTRLARFAMRNPVIRSVVRKQESYIAGNRTLRTWNDLLATFPGLIGVKTGHTGGAGWSQAAAARGRYATIYATLLGSPARSVRNEDLTELLAYGLTRYTRVRVITKRVYAVAETPYGRAPLALRAAAPVSRIVRIDRTLTERVVAPAAVALPIRKGQPLGEVRVFAGSKLIARQPLVAGRAIGRPGFAGRLGWYAGEAAEAVWGWLT